jgi:prepilin peptidase CpaA
LLVFGLLLAAAAIQDIKSLKISNYFALSLVALFVTSVLVTGASSNWWQHCIIFTLFLVGGFILFSLRIFGGGDVKLLAATSLWFDFDGALLLLIAVTCSGGLAALVFITFRRMVPISNETQKHWLALARKGPIPYGLGIATGGIGSLQYLSQVAS